MKKLSRSDLLSLEIYSQQRDEFRANLIAHKKNRRLQLGDHIMLTFEDRLTMQYQIQEMLRIERIFEAKGIEDELSAYNPLIPDGSNWKATLQIEYENADERKEALTRLLHIEDQVYTQVQGFDRVRAIADEDLPRETAEKTSAVHFLRFDLSPAMVSAAKAGTSIKFGVDHRAYCEAVDAIPESLRLSLLSDLD